MKIKIGLVDDHLILLNSLTLLINTFSGFEVVLTATNGLDLIEKINSSSTQPDILLIDQVMPRMNGLETTKWLRHNYPSVKLVALSNFNNDQLVIEMIKAGCCSFLVKDIHADELNNALIEIYEKNYYNSEINGHNLTHLLLKNKRENHLQVKEKEFEFLQHASKDITYKEIAQLMGVSERSVEAYRESLFAKFEVKSRTGLIVEAIRRGFIKV